MLARTALSVRLLARRAFATTAPLPTHASVVVVGGGVMGCSTLYHLARLGVSDAVLIERNELTSGTTWHSAAQVRALRSSQNMTDLIKYSIELYGDLEAETGQSVGWINEGSLSVASTPERLVQLRRQAALARAYGVRAEEVSAAEAAARWPLMRADDILGAVWSPDDGRVGPSDLCAALSKGARARGAKIFEHVGVEGRAGNDRRNALSSEHFKPLDLGQIKVVPADFRTDRFLSGKFFSRSEKNMVTSCRLFLFPAQVEGVETERGAVAAVLTDRGRVSCDALVVCAGLWSREVAALGGVDAPLWPCEHFYMLTKPVDGMAANMPTLSDHDSHLYVRDDSGGLLVGCFEPMGKAAHPDRFGRDFSYALLDEDWDHFERVSRRLARLAPRRPSRPRRYRA